MINFFIMFRMLNIITGLLVVLVMQAFAIPLHAGAQPATYNASVPDSTEEKIRLLVDAKYRDLLVAKSKEINLDSLQSTVVRKYGELGEQVILDLIALDHYLHTKDIDKWYSLKLMKQLKYPADSVTIFDRNNDAWFIFQHSSDSNKLLTALAWSRLVIDCEPTANYYDTYANILYKLGRRKEAISAEEKALNLPPGNGDPALIYENLKKMQGNQPTWE
jgi:tetratricopeptide (TPR) repeat protein